MVHGRSFRFALLLLTMACSMTCMQCTPSSPASLSEERHIESVSSALANNNPTALDASLGKSGPAHRNLVLAESDPPGVARGGPGAMGAG